MPRPQSMEQDLEESVRAVWKSLRKLGGSSLHGFQREELVQVLRNLLLPTGWDDRNPIVLGGNTAQVPMPLTMSSTNLGYNKRWWGTYSPPVYST